MRKLVVFLAVSLVMSGCAVAPGGVAPGPKPEAEARLRANGVLSHNGSQLVAAGAGNALPKAGIVSAGAGNALPTATGLVAAGAGNAKAPTDPMADMPRPGAAALPQAGKDAALVGNGGNTLVPIEGGGGTPSAPVGVSFTDLTGFAPAAGFTVSAGVKPNASSGPGKPPGPLSPIQDEVSFQVAIAGKLRTLGAGGALEPVKGVKVRLYGVAGAELGVAVTGDEGAYTLPVTLPAGVYAVRAAFTAGATPTYLAALVDVAGASATAEIDPGTTMLEAHLFALAAKTPDRPVGQPEAGALAGWNQALSALATQVPAAALAPGLSAAERDALGEALHKEAEKAFAGVAGLVVAP